jgi:hypothetical protein
MDENNKDNINSNEETNENPKVDENQSQGESSYTENNSFETSNENQEEIQPKIEENNNHEVIHKKEGRFPTRCVGPGPWGSRGIAIAAPSGNR